jgi:hypothetical protein
MALEDAVLQLASAVARNQQGAAVAEIIRQRDYAFAQRDRWKRDAEFYEGRRNEAGKRLERANRRIAALQGVITKMKRKAALEAR